MRAVLDLLAPPRCLACRARGSLPWCPDCADATVRLLAGPLDVGHLGTVDAGVAAFDYRGVVATAIATAKVHGARAAWPALGRTLAAAVDLPEVDVVTWVPADRRRLRDRGFDHARSLAGPVAASAGAPLVALLEAPRPRPDQTSLPPAQRRRLSPDTFRATADLAGARVLLVDDVLTTGATVTVAAAALRGAGATSIYVAVLATAHRRSGRSPTP